MTTRRSRLQIRPNIGRGAKEIGSDVPAKKISAITFKCPPRKEIKENTKLKTRLEGNDLIEHVEVCDKTSSEHFTNDKELAPTDTDNIKECHDVSIAHSYVTSNEMNAGTRKVISENYSTLLNTNKECTVVLDRTLIPKKHTDEMEKCCANESSECSSVKSLVPELSIEKEQKCEEREQAASAQQNVHETGLKNTQSLHLSCSGADKEKNMIKSKENILREDNSTDSAVFEDGVVAQSSVITVEKKSSNKASSSEEITKRRNRFSKKPPERGTMTMMDLIFWNPPNNPMSQEKKTVDNISEADVSVLQAVEEEEEEIDSTPNLKDEELPSEEPSSLQNETEELPGPRVMIGPNGDITIDEDSLVIRRTDPEKTASKDIVHDVAGCTYNSFRKATPKHYWSDSETAKFYKALSILGTDFSLMLSLFPTRNRQELKNKFKREERFHRHLVDRAIRDHQQFDLTAFDDDEDDYADNGNDEDYELTSTNKKGNNRKKCKRKKRVKDKGSFEDNISDDDDTMIGPISKSNENIGVRKSTRKRKETSKEIPTYTSTPVGKRRQSKPRVPKPKKKAEDTPVEREYESLEIVEVPNENLEVVSEDQSIIVCQSPLASEEAHSSDVHVGVTETAQDVEMIDTSIELKQNEKQATNNVKQLNTPLQHTSTMSNNLLQPINSNQSNLTPGQLVLVAGKTNNTNEQIVHVYVVSQPPAQQNMQYTAGASVLNKTEDNSSS